MIRRLFLSRMGAAAAAGLSSPAVQPEASSGGAERWQPQRHAADDWLDGLAGKHRFFLDSTSPKGLGDAILYADNYLEANKSAYGLGDGDLAVVICLRHLATPFAFNDAIWSKYGVALSQSLPLDGAGSTHPPTGNRYRGALEGLAKRGVHFAVCDMATHHFAGATARATGTDAAVVYKEFVGAVIGNAHLVPAGIVAVNRAQERNYSLAQAG
jgi:hypothetical protein